MMKTRRKSKAAAAAAAAAASTRENSPAPAEATTSQPTSITVVIPDDLDTDVLANLLPDISLTSPSPDSIVALYRWIVTQLSENQSVQRELEETRAEFERKEIELDQALQDRESTTAELEATLEGVQKELAQVKQEKEELATSKVTLQTQISAISTTQTASSTEVETLKHRVEDVEREKRDLVGVVSRLEDGSAQREEEIRTLRGNLKQARQEHQALESQVRELRSSETSTKFMLDSATQQLALAKEEAARMSQDLVTKSDEFTKYRRAKHAEISQLQAAHDALAQTHAATESTLKALQSAQMSQSHQLTQALERVQDLTGQLAEQEATYSSEAAGLRRLVEMMEAREVQAKAIVDGIEKEWADVGDRAEQREAALRDEIENQKQRAEDAEKRMEELQGVLDKMDRGEFPIPTVFGVSAPSTPARGPSTLSANGTSDLLVQGMMGLSPTVAMASRSQKGGKTFTEVYSEFVKLQEEYARKSAECDHMDRTMSAVLAQIEERAPILTQQRAEYERLQSEASQLAAQLSQTLSERDAYAASAEENGQKFDSSTRENKLLSVQLGDLGRQVRALTKELGRTQDPSIPPDHELDQDDSLQPVHDVHTVITNNLVLFRSIPELQEQNQRLLKIVRELSAKMESEEKEYRTALDQEGADAVVESYEAIKRLTEQLDAHKKNSDLTIQAYMKERDTLRSMLERERASGRPAHGVNGEDLSSPTESSVSQSELERLLAETQSQFEAYRTEMGDDSTRLREEADTARKEASLQGTSLAKANAKIEYLNERHRMLQEQTTVQSRELDNLTKRNQQLYDQYTRIDIECNRVSEDLLTTNAAVEQLRNERANLLAEKKIWESVKGRLADDNKALAMERSHLSDLVANVQKMHNDLERSGENDRRRLENQIKMLENQTQDLRTHLQQERGSVRHLTLQKDIELKEMQTRIDKMTDDFAKTRESLVSAETSRKHLEERVEQLTRQLQGNEEKLAVYERRSSGVNSVAQRTDEDLTRGQALEQEVAELRSALKVAEVDLVAAKSHVQQFQEISQANETALATMNATHDEYKASTEAELARQKAAYDALQERLQAIQQDFVQTTEKYGEVHRTLDTERVAWANDKKTLEDTIVDITTSEKNSESDRASRETEIRQQEQRAKAAEERYAHELMAHAEAIKLVEDLKRQLSQATSVSRDHRTARETAEAKLAASEASWKQQKDALDKEVSDLQTRCKDLANQNNLLHQHLESVSSQAARIRQAVDASSSLVSGEDSADQDTKLSELRSVVTYLRREKEIVDLQLELSKQETTRLKTQIEHLNQSLEKTRNELSEERERAVEAAASDAQHAELVDRINQLAIVRESNATLRADCEKYTRRCVELDAKLKQISVELDPAKESLRVAQAELEAKNEQIKHLEEESRKWRERNTQLLTKYDRIDPAEVQSLKDEIDQLTTQKAQLESAAAERTREADDLHAKVAQLESGNFKLKDIGKQNNERFKTQMGRLKAEVETLSKELAPLRDSLATLSSERDELKTKIQSGVSEPSKELELSQQLEALRTEKTALEKALVDERSARANVTSVHAIVQREKDQLLAEKESWSTTAAISASGSQTEQWPSEKAELIKARDDASAQAEAAVRQAQKADEDHKRALSVNDNLKAMIDSLQRSRASEHERAIAQQQAAVKTAVEELKREMVPSTSAEETASRHVLELEELRDRLTKQHQEELKAAIEKAAAAARQEALAQNAHATSGNQNQVIRGAIAAHEAKMREHLEEEIAAAVERGRMEQAAKVKLKDSQLIKTQTRMKELEFKIKEWQDAGMIPLPDAAPAPAAPPAATPAPAAASTSAHPPPAAASTSTHPPPKPATGPTAPTAASTNRTLPRRPSMPHPADGPSRGRGRGIPRASAGLNIRGAGRGGPPVSPTSPMDGVSIIGASKRAREDGEASSDDSLVKRLKPDAKPVQLRRDRVPPPS
ncbi:hypothetical protein BKA93DRAFT_560042 [Sparassis latifolia]